MIKLKNYKYYLFNQKVLNSWESIFSAYVILFILLLLLPILDNEYSRQNIKYIIFILLNSCLLILELNATIQKNKRPIIFWIILNLPLWALIPAQVKFIFYGFLGLMKLSK